MTGRNATREICAAKRRRRDGFADEEAHGPKGARGARKQRWSRACRRNETKMKVRQSSDPRLYASLTGGPTDARGAFVNIALSIAGRGQQGRGREGAGLRPTRPRFCAGAGGAWARSAPTPLPPAASDARSTKADLVRSENHIMFTTIEMA